MKTISGFLILLALPVLLFTSCAGSYYVVEKPVEPYYVRPAVPYHGAVWIPGEWAWNGGRYVYINGYYTHMRAGHAWIRGYWRPSSHGYTWHRGHWK